MKGRLKHIIEKQVFELSISRSGKSFEWENDSDDYLSRILNPAIEQCFNEFDSGEQHLVIEKLEIDLGSFSANTFAEAGKQQLIAIMTRQLAARLRKADNKREVTKNFPYSQDDFWDREEGPDMWLSKQDAAFFTLKHFLTTGTLPWWAANNESKLIDTTPEKFNHLEQTRLNELKELIKKEDACLIRMVNHFTTEWLAEFLEAAGLRGKEAFDHWKLFWESIRAVDPGFQSIFKQNFWKQWFIAVNSGYEYPDLQQILRELIKKQPSSKQDLLYEMEEVCNKHILKKGFDKYVLSIRELLSYEAIEEQSVYIDLKLPGKIEDKNIIGSPKKQADKNADTLSTLKKPEAAKTEGLFISSAGLVLLHPFLTELFTSTGLWSQQGWKEENGQRRAIQLLHYLSYGNIDEPEHQLIFHKILCGAEMEMVLSAELPLSEQEQAACDDLLQAVIDHWQALKNTSIEGLQQAFLQRMGKLINDNGSYSIQVERLAQDILLSKLPWGYSIITLPWLKNMIRVSWI